MADRTYYVPHALISSGVLAAMRVHSSAKVFLCLLAHDGPNGVFPTKRTISRETGCCKNSVDEAICELRKLELVRVVPCPGSSNRYVPLLPTAAPPQPMVHPSDGVTGIPSGGMIPTPSDDEPIPSDGTQTPSIEHEAESMQQGTRSRRAAARPGVLSASTASVVTQTARSKPNRVAAKHTAQLSEEIKSWAVASPQNMHLYLRFGVDAFGQTKEYCEAHFTDPKKYPCDFMRFNGNEFHPFPSKDCFTVKHLQAFYWNGVTCWRHSRGHPLTLPNWSRLGKEISRAGEEMPLWDLYGRLYVITFMFEMVRWRIGGGLGASLFLDESTINHALVKQQAIYLTGLTSEQVAEQWDLMQRGARPIDNQNQI